jgi:hypothetical protein
MPGLDYAAHDPGHTAQFLHNPAREPSAADGVHRHLAGKVAEGGAPVIGDKRQLAVARGQFQGQRLSWEDMAAGAAGHQRHQRGG